MDNKKLIIFYKSYVLTHIHKRLVELNNIKSKLYDEILGLITYQYQKPGVPMKTTRSDWSIVALSGGQWVFGLNKTFNPQYTFIHIQT